MKITSIEDFEGDKNKKYNYSYTSNVGSELL